MMPGFAHTLSALALAWPLGGLSPAEPVQSAPAVAAAAHSEALDTPEFPGAIEYPVTARSVPLHSLKVTLRQSTEQGTVRIERRVYVRIAPRSVSARRNMLAQLPVRSRRYEEKASANCVPVSRIAGVETGSGNRLLLFLRDRKIMSVNLEKACRARDFYSGFYVERKKDGKLCVNRDTLQSRNGARCDIARMMQLKAIEE